MKQSRMSCAASARVARAGRRGRRRCAVAPAPALAQQGKIKVGLMLPYTGTYAALGNAITNGFKLAIEENGGKLGRPRRSSTSPSTTNPIRRRRPTTPTSSSSATTSTSSSAPCTRASRWRWPRSRATTTRC